MTEHEERAVLSTAEINNLPDSAFAYIEPGGEKDDEGKTTPRSLRHYPVPDKAHADDAAARAAAAIEAGGDEAAIAEKALPKIKAAQAKFDKQSNSADPEGEERDKPTSEDPGISDLLAAAKVAVARVHAAQLEDPDNGTDPDDEAVMAKIVMAEAALDGAIVAQSKDGHKDPKESKSSVPAVPKRAFFSLTERPVPVEMRMDPGDDPAAANFVGYASTTGTPYGVTDWLGEYRETIAPGAFAKTLREQSDVPLLFNHDGIPLASTGSGTSRLSEDGQGLRNEATLDRSDGLTNTICVQLRRGVLNKMSFSFRAIKDAWNDAYDDRSVTELALFDTSIVTYPANPTTTAELRSEFREALGREGMAAMFSVRAAYGEFIETRTLTEAAEPIIEQAVRALAAADEVMCRRATGPYVRSRTFLVAGLMEEVRAGKKLSAKNEQLLNSALNTLNGASKQHAKVAAAHEAAATAIGSVLDDAAGTNGTGENQGASAGDNNINPKDGAGPRSQIPASVLRAKHEVELLKLARR